MRKILEREVAEHEARRFLADSSRAKRAKALRKGGKGGSGGVGNRPAMTPREAVPLGGPECPAAS